jgi:hypothetical protein
MVRQDYTKPRLQVFRLSGGYFTIPAKYVSKDCGDSVEITVTISKNKK